MTRKEFLKWLNTYPVGEYEIHHDGGGYVVVGFPFFEEDKKGESIDEYLGIKEESLECNGFTRVLDDGNSVMTRPLGMVSSIVTKEEQ